MKHWKKGRYIISEVTSVFGKKQYVEEYEKDMEEKVEAVN